MITIRNADIKMFTENGLEGQISHIAFKRDDQSFDTLKELGRAKATNGMLFVMQSIQYHGIQLYPDIK